MSRHLLLIKHLNYIFEESELDEKVVVSKMEITTQHGAISNRTQTKETQFYNLDAIISVGYRVNFKRATNFRIWATGVLKEYMTICFAMDDERLKQGKNILQQISIDNGSEMQNVLRNITQY